MTVRFTIAMLAAFASAAAPAHAAVDCLNDDELATVVRSVVTRSIGRVMRGCATRHAVLEQRALDATTGLLAAYAEDMRANRLAANRIVSRIHGDGWEVAFDTMLTDATAADEMWTRTATEQECADEIARVESMAAAADYAVVMAEGLPRRALDAQAAAIPLCGQD